MNGINIKTQGEYPRLWQLGLIQQRVRERAGHTCEGCGMAFAEGTNLALHHINRDGRPVVGTVHHIDGNKSNCTMANLVFLCQRCHYSLHLLGWTPGGVLPRVWRGVPPPWIVKRGLPWRPNPQLLLVEVER